MNILVGDIVFHQLSKLLFKCENKKMMRWMNMNPFYRKTILNSIDYDIFDRWYPDGDVWDIEYRNN